MDRCLSCGEELTTGGCANINCPTNKHSEPKQPEQQKVVGLYGWICPICKSVMSPFTPTCLNTHLHYKITTSTTSHMTSEP